MTRLMHPVTVPLPYPEDVRVDKRSIQKTTLNDPVLQESYIYLNAEKTAYLYLEDSELYYQPDDDGTRVKLS